MATFTAGALGVDFDQIDIGTLGAGQLSGASSTSFAISTTGETDQFFGSGFTFGAGVLPLSGTVTEVIDTSLGVQSFDLSGLSVLSGTLSNWISTDSSDLAKATILAGPDLIVGSDANDLLRGYGGNDTISGGSGGLNYLRGDEGDDSISGGAQFDDINGNMGNDTAHGNGGDDWVVGGKDNDMLFGDAGSDIVWGNLGNDTLDGGDGNDQARGGQGDDVVNGGAGDDYVSGDRGNDTITGGAGADLFHGSQDAGIDKVMDFHLAEGDRVMLDPGTTYTVSQVGADTVIDMGASANGTPNEMILVGVQMSTLTPGWIFEG
jgi:serralysin